MSHLLVRHRRQMVVRRADGTVLLSSLRIQFFDGPGPARPQPRHPLLQLGAQQPGRIQHLRKLDGAFAIVHLRDAVL